MLKITNLQNITFLLFFSLMGIYSVKAQSVFGKWKTFDIFNKDKEESIVEIYQQNDLLFVKIIKIIPIEHREDVCSKCEGENKNKPIQGLVILNGATLKDNVWQGAKILNAKNGFYYGCNISLKDENWIKIRGFIGYPFFGKTVYWEKVTD